MGQSNRIDDYMSPNSHSTCGEESLRQAAERMHRLRIPHLAVVQGRVLAGVLSEREVELARSLPQADFSRLNVAAVMNQNVYPVPRCAPLGHVVRTLLAHGYLCAVVMEFGAVAGVFTLADALRALGARLNAADEQGTDPEALLEVLVAEHAHLEALLQRARTTVCHAQRSLDPERALQRAAELSRHLRIAMRFHHELEQRTLSPRLAQRNEDVAQSFRLNAVRTTS